MPGGLAFGNLERLREKMASSGVVGNAGMAAAIEGNIDAALTWDFLAWMRTVTNLPILVKVECT